MFLTNNINYGLNTKNRADSKTNKVFSPKSFHNPSFGIHFGVDSFESGFLINDTDFFRDLKGLNFLVEYIEKAFSHKSEINIYDGACSLGYEPYTILMLLNEKNLLDKIRIRSFDLSSSVIEQAKKYIVTISKENDFWFFSKDKDDEYKFKKHLFLNLFERKDNFWQKIFYPFKHKYSLKPEFTKYLSFTQANIKKLDTIDEKKADVILFRNAFYHLISSVNNDIFIRERTFFKPDKRLEEEKLFVESVFNKLSDGGLLIFGDDERNQFGVCYKEFKELLLQQGFEPLGVTSSDVSSLKSQFDYEFVYAWRKK